MSSEDENIEIWRMVSAAFAVYAEERYLTATRPSYDKFRLELKTPSCIYTGTLMLFRANDICFLSYGKSAPNHTTHLCRSEIGDPDSFGKLKETVESDVKQAGLASELAIDLYAALRPSQDRHKEISYGYGMASFGYQLAIPGGILVGRVSVRSTHVRVRTTFQRNRSVKIREMRQIAYTVSAETDVSNKAAPAFDSISFNSLDPADEAGYNALLDKILVRCRSKNGGS